MTELNDLRIDEESQLRSYIYEAFGPPTPGEQTGAEFLAQLMSTPDLPSNSNDTIEQILHDSTHG